MTNEPLRATDAARRLGITTREMVRLMYHRRIRYVMENGKPCVPADAIEEYRSASE